MTTRTFKQQGLGYGVEPLTIVAKINGVVAYEGPVTTVDEPLPSEPETPEDWEKHVVLFSWTNTVDFEGTAEVEIAVVGNGTLMIARTVANYSKEFTKNDKDEYIPLLTGINGFGSYFYEIVNGVPHRDPFKNPKIDGVDVERNRDSDDNTLLQGQWFYEVEGGSTFTGTLHIQKGVESIE